MGGYIVGSPLASAYAMRSTARWWLGHGGWQEDFNRALAMARDADPISKAAVIAYTYDDAIGSGVIAADDTAVATSTRRCRALSERPTISPLPSPCTRRQTRCIRIPRSANADSNYSGRFAKWRSTAGIYAMMVPVIDVRLAEEMIGRGDPGAVPHYPRRR